MRFREAQPEDFEIMAVRSTNQTVDRKFVERVDYSYTLEDKCILGMGGFSMITPTTYWCWISFTPEGEDKLLTSYRVIVEWTDTFVKKMNIKRLQAFVADEPTHIRLVEHLGFERESTMTNFFGDKDAFLYRRLF